MVDQGRNYPPNVVEVALLSFAWQVADRAEELFAAFTDPSSMREWKDSVPRSGTPRRRDPNRPERKATVNGQDGQYQTCRPFQEEISRPGR